VSLKSFHILFITMASLLAFGFGAWALSPQLAASYRALGVVSLVLGAGLIVYGVWFLRKIRTPEQERERRRAHLRPLVVLVALWLADSRAALACSVCYGDAEGPLIDAAKLGVWLLFGLVLCLQALFVLFFVVLWKRARNYHQHEKALS